MTDETYKQLDMFKATDPSLAQQSVVEYPQSTDGIHRTILYIANAADDMIPWSTNPRARDRELRQFWKTEPLLASAMYAAIARAVSFRWEIVPTDRSDQAPKRTMKRITEMLHQSDRGNGWQEFLFKVLTDYYSQDNGAFIELIRLDNSDPTSPVLNVAHLDSARCERTGNPTVPVVYTDRNGREHKLYWWQVETLEEMPAPDEDAFGVQMCAVSRALLAAQILRDIAIYKREKVSGRFARAIHFVSGVSKHVVDDALTMSQESANNMGLLRYTQPVIVAGIDPSHGVDVDTIDLATLPDSFNEDDTYKWYIAQLSMAFGVDYQEFAPLPGGNLGSSQQSQILHMKTQGKGPALVMAALEHLFNNTGILPNTVQFEFKEHDLRAENDRADASYTRSKNRSLQLSSGVLDPDGALDLAVLDGDIPEYIAQDIKDRGLAMQWYMSRLDQGEQLSTDQITGGQISDEPDTAD